MSFFTCKNVFEVSIPRLSITWRVWSWGHLDGGITRAQPELLTHAAGPLYSLFSFLGDLAREVCWQKPLHSAFSCGLLNAYWKPGICCKYWAGHMVPALRKVSKGQNCWPKMSSVCGFLHHQVWLHMLASCSRYLASAELQPANQRSLQSALCPLMSCCPEISFG